MHLTNMGIFPDCLKIPVVKPLYKSGNKTSMTNYWPVSLLRGFFFQSTQESFAQ